LPGVSFRRGEKLAVHGAHGLEDVPARAELLAYARRLVSWIEVTRQPVFAGPEDARFGAWPGTIAGALALPWDSGRLPGGLVLGFPGPEEEIDPALGELLSRLGGLAVARFRAEQQHQTDARRLDELETRLVSADRLAALGEMAAQMTREIKAPLVGLGSLVSQVAGEFGPEDPRREILETVVEEAARLDRILDEQLDLARRPEPDLELEDLNRLIGECLNLLSEEFRNHGVRVTRRLGPSLPELLFDPDLMRRVVLNLLRSAVSRVPRGGRIKIETKRRGDRVELGVSGDGAREPGGALDALWTPFLVDQGAAGSITVSGVDRLIRQMGGVLRVESTRDWPLRVTLTFPIGRNLDRRQLPEDRRSGRERRDDS
jgi:signal transduction histidine kinase